jgi:2-polyprenyl-3-methyl-5-hydroxy-6-metoxy-1,4-benzoquinol methylase
MKVSVVCATYNRAELLDRALETYAKQTIPRDEWEYVLVDDLSTDNTLEVCAKYKEKINLRVLDSIKDLGLPKQPGQWRDGCKLRNAASTFAFGEVMVSTHPEIMVPPDALERAYNAVVNDRQSWHTAIPYWLPPCDVDSVDWRASLANLNTLPGFYDPSWPDAVHSPGAPDYRNQNQEVRKDWESEVWWAIDMHLWRWSGGFREFEAWGAPDLDFNLRRSILSIPTKIITVDSNNKSLMVYHQFHDSPRNMELAMEAVKYTSYKSSEDVRRQGGLYNVYYHGHRERSENGVEGVMPDHVARYEWAAQHLPTTGESQWVDLGCGTGYGSTVVPINCTYVGFDIDAESIRWARDHYGVTNKRSFFCQGLDNIWLLMNRRNLVTSFEVLEHVEDQQGLINTAHELLIQGGTLLLSTPQKGATPGTAWDRFILTHKELLALFSTTRWKIEPFYQLRYGISEVQPGTPPADAEIQLIRATKV